MWKGEGLRNQSRVLLSGLQRRKDKDTSPWESPWKKSFRLGLELHYFWQHNSFHSPLPNKEQQQQKITYAVQDFLNSASPPCIINELTSSPIKKHSQEKSEIKGSLEKEIGTGQLGVVEELKIIHSQSNKSHSKTVLPTVLRSAVIIKLTLWTRSPNILTFKCVCSV